MLNNAAFTGAYRYPEAALNARAPIFWADATVNAVFGGGTYWLDWAFSNPVDVFGDPYQIPITIDGQTTTGNALWTPVIGMWGPVVDVGRQGFPFQVFTNSFDSDNDGVLDAMDSCLSETKGSGNFGRRALI